MKRIVYFLLVILLFTFACGGGGGQSSQQTNLDSGTTIDKGLDTYFPFYEGMSASFSDGSAQILAISAMTRSNVFLEVISGNILRMQSNVDYNYHANTTEEHEIIIDGDSVKLAKSIIVLEWIGPEPETWTNVWEYDPPITLIEDRSNIEIGNVVTENINISFSGTSAGIENLVTGETIELPPMTEPVDIEVIVSEGDPVVLAGEEVATYNFRIVWAYGLNNMPGNEEERYSVFDGLSIFAPGFRLVKGEGIVAFGSGVIVE